MMYKSTNKLKYIHIGVVVLGAVFVLFSCFHINLWFDESYSVAISSRSFAEIWSIGSHDVHPVLYYWMLKIIGLITNKNVLAYRLFSASALIITAILGYTHIRKDFGEKVGLAFSFLVLFMPVTLVYAGEIRMYTWAMLFVTLTAIYGYRIYKNDISKKNWVIFSIFSLASAYTHYYGTVAAAVINVAIFVYFIVNTIKKKDAKYKTNLIYSTISACLQVALFLPWAGALLNQFGQVKESFWIHNINIIEMFEFQFTGNLDSSIHLTKRISYVFTLIMLIYMIYVYSKNIKKSKPANIALTIYFGTIIVIALISIIAKILYARYLLTITGIFLFAFAYIIASDKCKVRVGIICALIVVVSSILNAGLIQANYDGTNNGPYEIISENIEEDDIILIDNNGSGFVIAAYFTDHEVYFWDSANWNVEEAYKAYGHTVYNLDDLEGYEGRIWIISESTDEFKEKVETALGGGFMTLLNEKFYTAYREYMYSISLIER